LDNAPSGSSVPWTRALPAGDGAVLLEFGTRIDPVTNAAVHRVFQAIEADPPAGVTGLIPAYATLLVEFDPRLTTRTELLAALAGRRYGGEPPAPRRVVLPVLYGGEAGPDLEEVARWAGVSPDEVVRLHADRDYRIYCIGFAPGFPLSGIVPEAIQVPRRASPRTRVPRGSVAIAGQQTGVYPAESPGGWHLLGKTPVPLFDLARTPPVPYRPGDLIRFRSVDAATYAELAARWAAGELSWEDLVDGVD
jgi:inhibitor of KinA